ncbi:conserved hypothetical protein [Nitrosopumilaceae archaeon]|nr:SAM-dependent methyltransferase [Nitrosopumilus sp.]MDA7944969.1 SAM-dependent methyltransferase [Nitrosopumilus sp.]MDA7973776.1 SAM-dependent methyltransferase [Nitrosopumilus sp.]CAI9831008.1 conserved hypothetical protein [Nitrosopumilaceae archaeon]
MAYKGPVLEPDVSRIVSVCSKWPHKRIISGLLNAYLDQNNLVSSNLMLKKLIRNSKNGDAEKIKTAYQKTITINEIEACLGHFIVVRDQEKYGVVYTPKFITRYIIKKTVSESTRSFCDPSCGLGIFLVEAAIRLHKLKNEPIIKIIENRLYGADILAKHVLYSKILLTLLALENGEDKRVITFNLTVCDTLEFDWHKKYPKISNGFDTIATNPPYIRIQDMTNIAKNKITSKWKTCQGSFNAYFPFIEWGYENLHKDGHLGYINSNSFFTSFAGLKLREWVQKNRFIKKVIDFKHLVLFDATSYTCILFADKKPKSGIYYGYVRSHEQLSYLDNMDFSMNKYRDLNPKKWRLLLEDEQENIRKIESVGIPLGKLAIINSGIATLKDKIFLVPYSNKHLIEKQYLGKKYLVEKSLTKDIIKIPDVDKTLKTAFPTHKIIFPYVKKSGGYIPIPEKILQKKYPHCYEYLKAMKKELASRDKGKKNYEKWYCYGRVQGFNIVGPKLLTPTFSSKPHFMFDNDVGRFFCNGYAVHGTEISLKILQKILNSSVMDYYITRTSVYVEGGYSCFQKNFIEKFGIPNFTKKEIMELKTQNDIDKINNMLEKKYNVTLH